VSTGRTLPGAPFRIGSRMAAACACGGLIVAWPTPEGIRRAVERHNAKGRHYEWRAITEAQDCGHPLAARVVREGQVTCWACEQEAERTR
jgi:hypothetical protein